jgi:glycosyltransferase involved in cell wall biosynthesis
MKISIILPVFNEEKFLEKCLTSLARQTLKPTQVIIVDDGSTDSSPQILKKFAFPVLTLPVQKSAMIERVPYVLRKGSKLLDDDFDYVGVLDADTVLEPAYYAKLVAKLQSYKGLGIAGGKLIGQPDTGRILGLIPYVYGCNRLYTRKCWFNLNGGKVMKPVPTWDTYHNIYAQMLGFKAVRFDEIKSWALRPAGLGKDFNKGYQSYQLGYYGLFLFGRALKNGNLRMMAGYLKAMFAGEKQYPVKTYIRRVQIYRIKRLLAGRLG